MDTPKTSSRIHPLIAGAAVSVIAVCLLGVAAITGVLPSSHGSAAPAVSAPAGVPSPIAAPDANSANSRPSVPSQATSATVLAANESEAAPLCRVCGTVESVRAIQQHAKPSGVGVVAGAVLGGVLGNQVGNGNGRTLATVAGAVGGGYAGNEVEKRTHTTTSYQVRVRMENGKIRTFPFAAQPGWNAGDHVKVVDGNLRERR